ncbi:MAG: radical SAM protein [Methanomassiliicoccales archaeon]|jgi:radical SAM protein with 4Fe4S-binding SPASM domain
MKTGTSVQVLKTMIGNPVTRKVLSGMSKYCETDKKNRLEVALELYVGERDDACTYCKIAKKPLASILKRGAKSFGVTEEEMKKTFKNPYWRKGLSCVVKGIADFGVKKPFVPGAPFQVVWDVTNACNLKCQHCYAQAGKVSGDELTHEEALRVVDKLATMGIPVLALSGGEPLVRPDILDIARRGADHGMYVSIATNGTLITKEKARRMKEAGVSYLQISVDGADAATHDNFRGIPGAFDKTIQGVKNAVAEGFFVSVATTATKKNLTQIPKIIDLCDSLGVNWFMVYNFVPTGRGKLIIENDLSPQEREDLLVMLFNKLKETDVEILTTAPQYARIALQNCGEGGPLVVPTHFSNPQVDGSLFSLTEFIGGCGAGRFYMAIRANGNIEPCVFFPLRVGNVRTDDIEDIWRNNKVFAELRNKDILEDNCRSCDYRYHCGGCRARAYGYFGNYKAPDPGCINNVAYYNEIIKDVEEKSS